MAQHYIKQLIFSRLRMAHREISINRERSCVPYLLAPLLLYIKAGTGFVGKFIMTMNRG